jgi:hypothetical protein
MTVGALKPAYEKAKKKPAYPNDGKFENTWEKVIY